MSALLGKLFWRQVRCWGLKMRWPDWSRWHEVSRLQIGHLHMWYFCLCILKFHNFMQSRLALSIIWNQGWPWSCLPGSISPVLGFRGCHHTQLSEASFNCWISPNDLQTFKASFMQAHLSLVLNLDFLQWFLPHSSSVSLPFSEVYTWSWLSFCLAS